MLHRMLAALLGTALALLLGATLAWGQEPTPTPTAESVAPLALCDPVNGCSDGGERDGSLPCGISPEGPQYFCPDQIRRTVCECGYSLHSALGCGEGDIFGILGSPIVWPVLAGTMIIGGLRFRTWRRLIRLLRRSQARIYAIGRGIRSPYDRWCRTADGPPPIDILRERLEREAKQRAREWRINNE